MLKCGLRGLSCFYGSAVALRNVAFQLGIKRTRRAAAPVISVGNITTGGTGKTPFVAYLTRWFGEKGLRVVLLSRGYRALPGEVNDEKLLLDRLCPNVTHLQNPNRVQSADVACREHQAQLLLLDDGFQHRRLGRDLDIVLVDAVNPFGYGRLLPRGLLREPISSLRRADFVVLTRADQIPRREKQEVLDRIAAVRGNSEIVQICYPPVSLVNATGETTTLASLNGQTVAAFCGIGNPEAFHRMLLDSKFQLAPDSFHTFPDHHHYTTEEIDTLAASAKQRGATALLATHKDLVKINRTDVEGIPLWAVEIGVRVLADSEILEEHLMNVLRLVER